MVVTRKRKSQASAEPDNDSRKRSTPRTGAETPMRAFLASADAAASNGLPDVTSIPIEAAFDSRSRNGESAFHTLRGDLLNALPVAVYMTDHAGRITFYNEAAADLWGHRPELGKDEWCGSW